MGAYSQRRKRGGGGLKAAVGPSLPTPATDSWHVTPSVGGATITIESAPGDVSFYQGRWKPAASSTWSIWSFAPTPIGDELEIAADLGLDDFQIRYSNDIATITGAPSATKQATVV